jgi:hypothetical protein
VHSMAECCGRRPDRRLQSFCILDLCYRNFAFKGRVESCLEVGGFRSVWRQVRRVVPWVLTLWQDDVRRYEKEESDKLCAFVSFGNTGKDTKINAFGEARKKSAGVGGIGKQL